MIKNIIFDFDGVIIDSMPIRDMGFREIFKKYKKHSIDKFLIYHNENGGLSRFVKIRYFFENIIEKSISEEEVLLLSKHFSEIMKKKLINKNYLINDSLVFIKENYKKYNFHIASGSENIELNYLCKKLDIEKYFLTISGSPTHKNQIVETILSNNSYQKDETILIGDSINDFQAAKKNKISFYGYNNIELKDKDKYINSFSKGIFCEI